MTVASGACRSRRSAPETSVRQAPRTTAAVTDVALAAGDYWVMAVFDSVASVGVSYTGSFQFRELTFGGGTPDPFGAATTVSGQTFNFYINVY